MVGPPEPNTEASQKQTYVPGQDFERIYKPKTFTIKVKVVSLTYFEELLVRTRAKTFTSKVKVVSLTHFEELLVRTRGLCLILCYRHILYIVVFSKTAPFLGLKSIVFGPNCYVTTANRSAIYPLSL